MQVWFGASVAGFGVWVGGVGEHARGRACPAMAGGVGVGVWKSQLPASRLAPLWHKRLPAHDALLCVTFIKAEAAASPSPSLAQSVCLNYNCLHPPHTFSVLGFQPGIVFWTTCLLTLLAAGVAASLPVGQASKAGARSSTAVARTEQVVVAGAGCSAAAEADGNEQQQLLVVSVTGSGSDAVGCQQRDAVGISEKRTPHGRAGDKVELLTPLPARRTLPLSDAVAQRDAGLEGRSAQQQSQSRGSFSDGMRRLLSLSGQGVPGGGEQLPTSPGATDNGSLEPLLRPSTPQG